MTPHSAPLAPLAGRPTVDAVLDKPVTASSLGVTHRCFPGREEGES